MRGKEGIEAFILFPKGRVSEVQQRQMTSMLDSNIHCIAVEGTFDDCQDAVKALFNDAAFKEKHRLAAVNSINWARIAAQIVYYFRAYYDATGGNVRGAPTKVAFSVPTGNFGNILAGWYAKRMGLPVEHLVLATNQNDILHRFFSTGTYEKKGVVPTISPSMDIQVASNFERFLYHLHGDSPDTVKSLMAEFAAKGSFTVSPELLAKARLEISTCAVSETETRDAVGSYIILSLLLLLLLLSPSS